MRNGGCSEARGLEAASAGLSLRRGMLGRGTSEARGARAALSIAGLGGGRSARRRGLLR